MMNFMSIVLSLVLFPSPTTGSIQIEDVEVEFSEKAIGIESGQPIFSKSTKIWVSNPTQEDYRMYINEEEKKLNEEKLEIAGLTSGTYTLMILAPKDSDEENRTIGFTIQ